MAVWTEVVTENVGVTHVGTWQVAFPIGDVSYEEVRDTVEYIEFRKQHCEEMKELKEEIEQRKNARQQIEAAGYDPSEIPL